MLLESMFRITV